MNCLPVKLVVVGDGAVGKTGSRNFRTGFFRTALCGSKNTVCKLSARLLYDIYNTYIVITTMTYTL